MKIEIDLNGVIQLLDASLEEIQDNRDMLHAVNSTPPALPEKEFNALMDKLSVHEEKIKDTLKYFQDLENPPTNPINHESSPSLPEIESGSPGNSGGESQLHPIESGKD